MSRCKKPLRNFRLRGSQTLHCNFIDANRENNLLESPQGESKEFLREMRELGRIHSPFLIILLEQKISGIQVDEIYRKLR